MTPSVIFDFDGTLADTLDDITDAMNEILPHYQRPPISTIRMKSLIGEGLHELIRKAAGVESENDIAQFVAHYRPAYAQRMLNKTRLYDGVAETLTELTNRNIPMAVLSNKPHRFTAPICDALLAEWPFVQCRGHVDGGPRKPDPAVAIEIADIMDRNPANTLFVGDSDVDIATARRAGMTAVAVTWGFRDPTTFPNQPDHTIDTPQQLLTILNDH
jgi:phosphoglycolate phosphatase